MATKLFGAFFIQNFILNLIRLSAAKLFTFFYILLLFTGYVIIYWNCRTAQCGQVDII